jgi:hypothetical protein
MIFVWSINGSSMEQDFNLVSLKVVVNLNELIEFVVWPCQSPIFKDIDVNSLPWFEQNMLDVKEKPRIFPWMSLYFGFLHGCIFL